MEYTHNTLSADHNGDASFPLSMYEMPGERNITSRTLNRQLHKTRELSEIQKVADTKTHESDFFRTLHKKISEIPEHEQAKKLTEVLRSENVVEQECAAELLAQINSKYEVAEIIRYCFTRSHKALEAALKHLWMANVESIAPIIDSAFALTPGIQIAAAAQIPFASDREKVRLRSVFANIVERHLEGSDEETQIQMAKHIHLTADDRQIALHQKAMTKSIAVQVATIESFWQYSYFHNSMPLYLDAFDRDIEVQKAAAEYMTFAPKEEIHKLMHIALQKDRTVQGIAMGNISYVPENHRQEVLDVMLEIINEHLASTDEDSRKFAARMVWNIPKELREPYMHRVAALGLTNELVRSSLYDDKRMSKKRFERKNFEKTGSETTLVGGPLLDKSIVRHIEPRAFLAWYRLYTDPELWKREGFDYVPIEPIHSFHLNKDGLVDVFSGVLDLDFSTWSWRTDLFKDELQMKMDAIESALAKTLTEHGHTHTENFCLRFFRDENGNADLSREPRVYLIDFDQASSPAPTPANQ